MLRFASMAAILVVDDEKNLLDLMKSVLEAAGHEVLATTNPKQALAILDDEGTALPDLVISDVMMPGLDGYTLMARLAGNERTKGLKVLVVTSKAKLEGAFAQAANLAGFITKPFPLAEFRKAVEAALPRK